MIKVLYLRSSFDPGGTESLLLNLFNYPQEKIQFHYAFLRDGSLISHLNSESNRYYKVFRRRRLDVRVIKKLSHIIKENDISIVHTHQMFELFYAALLKLKHPRLKIFHSIHGYHDEHSKWAEWLEKILIYFTHKTFTVSYSTRNILEQRGYPAKNIEVLYNAVKPPTLMRDELMAQMKKRIYYKEDDFVVGMIGSFVWQKDQLTLVKAFNLLKDEMPNLKVVFIGKESEFSDRCQAEVANVCLNTRVFFLGAVENAAGYFSLFDLFVMSTLMDTFGIVVIEALMSKVPVLASDIDVMKELSQNGRYFKLFEKGNYVDLACKIKNYYLNKKIYINYSYEIKNIFSYERYMENLIEMYTKTKLN